MRGTPVLYRIFKKRVCNMMNTLSKKNKEDTFTILDSLETVWKIQAKPIFFAYEFQLYDVIAHPTSVAWMNQKWYNGLTPNWKRFIWNIKVLGLLHSLSISRYFSCECIFPYENIVQLKWFFKILFTWRITPSSGEKSAISL